MKLLRRIWNWIRSLFGGKHREQAQFEASVRQMEEALRSMKAQTEAARAAQDKRRREEEECRDEAAKMERYAQKAVAEGRDSDARFFLEKRDAAQKRLAEMTRLSSQVASYTSQADDLCRKAEAQLAELEARKDAVEAKMAAAKLQESMNQLGNGTLESMDAEAQAAVDKAEAMAELEGRGKDRELDELMRKYDQEGASAAGQTGQMAAR